MTEPPAASPRRVVFLPHWHDNPYQDLLADALRALGADVGFVNRQLIFLPAVWRQGRPSVLHLHAPDHFVVYRRTSVAAYVALVLYLGQLALLRLARVRIVWTVHDLTNHERRRPRLDNLSRRLTAALSDALIVHCREAQAKVAAALGIEPARVSIVPHGHYADRYPPGIGDRDAARAALHLPEAPLVLLVFGNLRRHKGLAALIDAYGRLDREGTRLVIAGEPFDDEIGADLATRAAACPGVELRAGCVPDAMVTTYLSAADVMICPFTSSLTSGSLALALSFGKAVVASRLGCVAEMVAEGGGFLYDADDPEGLLSALRAAVDARDRHPVMGEANRRRMLACDWHTVARQTLAAYSRGAMG